MAADLWNQRFHREAGQAPGSSKPVLHTSSASNSKLAKRTQHSTAPGVFVSAASLQADGGLGVGLGHTGPGLTNSGHDVTSSQPGSSQRRASWRHDEAKRRGGMSEVIDLVKSPGRYHMQTTHNLHYILEPHMIKTW